MKYFFKQLFVKNLVVASLILGAISAQAAEQQTAGSFTSAYAALIPVDGQLTRLELGEGQKTQWRNAAGELIAELPQQAELLDWRLLVDEKAKHLVAASLALPEQQPLLLELDAQGKVVRELLRLPLPRFKVENLCLSLDAANNLSLYLIDERGSAQQWLLRDSGGQLHAQLLRSLPIAPGSKACAVDDKSSTLAVVEESVGVWAYDADMEAAPGRKPLAMRQPFGDIQKSVVAVALVPNGLLALDKDARELLVYALKGKTSFALQERISLAALSKPERLSVYVDTVQQQLQVLIGDDKNGLQYPLSLPWKMAAAAQQKSPQLPEVFITPDVQTQVMARFGDAADDPAIWVNPRNAKKSRVLGTNKQQGLFVYDLQGRELQHFDSGKLNNVDLRQGVSKGEKRVDLAIATQREDNSLALFEIDPRSGKLTAAGSIATDLHEIYGFCMYQSIGDQSASDPSASDQSARDKSVYAIANSKSGKFEQLRISYNAATKIWQGEKVREFSVTSQPEGCVADDQRQRLFIGEEDVGIWTLGAEPNSATQLELVVKVDGVNLVDDVEGMAIYQGKSPYLVVSSQGNNTYVVLDAVAPYALKGIVHITLDAARGLDGVSETDGLEVTSANLSGVMGGVFSEGMLVVQDGHKVMPEAPQNFKYVAWEKIRAALHLAE